MGTSWRKAALAGALALLAGCGGGGDDRIAAERYDVESRAVGETLAQVAIVPPGDGPRGLLVFLHGRGEDGEESNANGDFEAALTAQGDDAPVVVFPSGGEASYWHDRGDGAWARYVLDEVIPAAQRRFGTTPGRVAIGGISMGGWGAFHLGRLRRFCAVGGHSAALWQTGGETPAGAFDDAEDFAAHDLLALARAEGAAPWGGAPLWLDTGDADPFRAADQALADALGVRLRVSPGGHDGDYWRAHYAAYLRFYARALADC